MANRIFQSPQLNLNPPNQTPLFVDMEKFFEFSFWLAEELSDLVASYELKQQKHPLESCNAKSNQAI